MVTSVGNNGLAEVTKPSLPKKAIVEMFPNVLEMAVAEYRREVVVGQNVHTYFFAVKEPNVGNEETGKRDTNIAIILALYRHRIAEHAKYNLGKRLKSSTVASFLSLDTSGYPVNLDFDYGALAQLQHFAINNCGDPFIECNYGVHSRQFEMGVLDWFARLWELKTNKYWGYVTNGGTEGNMHGILSGREMFPNGIFYTSRESHYSVFKAARMYRMECVRVETLVSGQMDCADFAKRLLENIDKPAIVNVNIGTTVKGAVDDLDLIIKTLEQNGFHNRFYIHCDGALFGMMIPFVNQAPKISFNKPIGSISISGHKFIGCPVPCGVLITRLEHMNNLVTDVEYIATRDATITGSRNGHAAIYLWYTLNRKGYSGFEKDVQKCLKNANYLKDRLKEAGIGSMLNELSNTVVFERPQNVEFIRRWQLACEGNIAHIVVMPSVTIGMLNNFINELIEKRATWYQDGVHPSPCIAAHVGPENCLCTLHKK